MRDEQHGAGGVHQCVLQALDRGKVEMIGGFVHHDEMGTALDAAREQDFANLAGAGGCRGEEPSRA